VDVAASSLLRVQPKLQRFPSRTDMFYNVLSRDVLFCQHAALWFSLRYFVFSIPTTAFHRGLSAILLASTSSFYAFAHTCGTEALLAVSWFIVFSKKKTRRRIRRGFPCDNLAGSLISFSTNVIRTRAVLAVLERHRRFRATAKPGLRHQYPALSTDLFFLGPPPIRKCGQC
jgi:hypothetical protein